MGPWVLAAAFGYTTLGSATVGVGGVLRVGGLVGAEVVAFAEHEVAIDTVGQVGGLEAEFGRLRGQFYAVFEAQDEVLEAIRAVGRTEGERLSHSNVLLKMLL